MWTLSACVTRAIVWNVCRIKWRHPAIRNCIVQALVYRKLLTSSNDKLFCLTSHFISIGKTHNGFITTNYTSSAFCYRLQDRNPWLIQSRSRDLEYGEFGPIAKILLQSHLLGNAICDSVILVHCFSRSRGEGTAAGRVATSCACDERLFLYFPWRKHKGNQCLTSVCEYDMVVTKKPSTVYHIYRRCDYLLHSDFHCKSYFFSPSQWFKNFLQSSKDDLEQL